MDPNNLVTEHNYSEHYQPLSHDNFISCSYPVPLNGDNASEFSLVIDCSYLGGQYARIGIIAKRLSKPLILRVQVWSRNYDTPDEDFYGELIDFEEHVEEAFTFTEVDQCCMFELREGPEKQFFEKAPYDDSNATVCCRLTLLGYATPTNVLTQKLWEGYLNKTDYDVTIMADGKEFKVFRFVLGAHSDAFRVMFSQKYAEGQNGVAKLDEISEKVMHTMLKWMYTGELMICDELEDLYVVADRYQIVELKTLCIKLLAATIYNGNATRRLALAKRHLDKDFRDQLIIAARRRVMDIQLLNQLIEEHTEQEQPASKRARK